MRDLELVGTFLEVYRSGSITAAASALGLSQPAVSERIARLEAQRGEPLFVRSTRGATPTAAADRLATQVGDAVDRLRASLAPSTAAIAGEVRVGGASDIVANRIVPTLAPLTGRGIELRFTLGLSDDLVRLLADGALDVVVASSRPAVRGIRYRGLVDEEFVLVGAPSLARSIDPVRLRADPSAALAHLPLVAYDTHPSIVRRYWRTEFGHRPTARIALVVPDLRGVLAAVVAGAGISALPRYLADPAVASGSVEILHAAREAPLNTLYLALSADGGGAAVDAVVDRLVEKARAWDAL